MLWVSYRGSSIKAPVPYEGDMPMWQYLSTVIAPTFGLECVDGTVLAKVHSPELRVVFNNECRHVALKTLVADYSELVISAWPSDGITVRSLMGNAQARCCGCNE
jgi:hypothetical protein